MSKPLPFESLREFIDRTICGKTTVRRTAEYPGPSLPWFFEPSYVTHPARPRITELQP